MRIAVSSKGETLESDIDERFGRCTYFVIAEVSKDKYEFLESVKNDGAERAGSAGPFAAKLLAEKNIEVIITGEVGPSALDVLKQFGIKIHKASGKVEDAIRKLANNLE